MTSTTGIRTELKVMGPDGCPIATVFEGGTPGYALLRGMAPNERGSVVEGFVLDDDAEIPEKMEKLFECGDGNVYRFDHEGGIDCPCEHVEAFDCPIVDMRTRGGALFLTFCTPDVEMLRDVIAALRESSGSADVRRLSQLSTNKSRGLVLVEHGQLTDRQCRMLKTAYEMGHFDHPRRANEGEATTELGIATSTFPEHLAMA